MEHNGTQSVFSNNTIDEINKICENPHSNATTIIRCDQDGLIYKTKEVLILQEVKTNNIVFLL